MTERAPDVDLPVIDWPKVEAVLELLGLTDLYKARRLRFVHIDPVNVVISVDYSDEGPGAYEDHFIPIAGEPTQEPIERPVIL